MQPQLDPFFLLAPRVVVEEACGFGYAFHRQLRQSGVTAFVVATEMLNRKRKTNRRDAAKLLDAAFD